MDGSTIQRNSPAVTELMNIHYFIKGIIIGFSIAAPVGPIGVLCIRRTLANGRLSGLISGLGASTADGFYSAIAAYGLTLISNILLVEQFWFRLLGGLFLLYLGAKTFVSKPSEGAMNDNRRSLAADYASTLFLTIINPMTIISFGAMFAGLGLGASSGNFASATMMVVGVVLGSALWWFILSSGISILKPRFGVASLRIVNRLSGSIIVLFAIFALASVKTFAGT